LAGFAGGVDFRHLQAPAKVVYAVAEPPSTTSVRSTAAILAAAAGVGVLICGLVFGGMRWWENRTTEARFQLDAEQRIGAIERDLAANFKVVEAVRAFYRASRQVEPHEFRDFVLPLLASQSSIRQIAWAPRVTGGERANHETDARQEGLADYQVTEVVPGGRLAPAQQKETYFPIRFREPHENDTFPAGLDLSSLSACRDAIRQARLSGEPQATGRVRLGWGDQQRETFLIIGPILVQGVRAPPPYPEDVVAGYVVEAYQLREVLEGRADHRDPAAIEVRLFDKPPSGPQELICALPGGPAVAPGEEAAVSAAVLREAIHHPGDLDVPGQNWSIICVPTAAYVARHRTWLPYGGLFVAAALATLLFAYVKTLAERADRVRRMVVEQTAEIREANVSLEREITERKRAEEVIRNSEALYSSLVENLPVNVLRKDLEGKFTFASKSFCEQIGTSPEAIVGKTDFDLYPRELAEKYRQDDHHVMATGQILAAVEENRQEGRKRYVEVLKSAVRDAIGEIIGIQVVFWDVTEKKVAEEALRASELKYRTLFDSSRDAIMTLTPGEGFLSGNPAAIRLFACRDEKEFTSCTPADLSPETQPDGLRSVEKAQQMMAIAIQSGSHFFEWKHRRIDGSEFFATVLLTKVVLADKTFLQATVRDVTREKQAAEALREAKEAAETASRAKSDFLANMSHEIRTPLNAVLGMTELVLDTGLDTSQREYLDMVYDSAESLLAVINDVLDFSKIEAGKLELVPTPFSLRESLGDTMKSLALRAHGKGLELACRVGQEAPDRLVGDAARLRQILINLVGNAIKFTESGEVVLEVQGEAEQDGEVVLHFAVRDTGIGIPEEKCLAIFDAFEQADSSTTRKFGGTGLGLAISAKLARFMGGELRVESQIGRGSTFHFNARFQLAEEDLSDATRRPPVVLEGAPVLVVDDNATNRQILVEMLGNWGMDATEAPGGKEAMTLLRQACKRGKPYLLVLSDANMPEVDGFCLAEQIKRDRQLGSTLIMMLTSGGRPGDVARCEQLGVAAYLLKPIKQSELFDAIVAAIGIAAVEDHAAGPAAGEPPTEIPPLRVLLAEDSLVNQKLAVGLLEKHGHAVVVANDGREAIAAMESGEFDLVLMDVQMPHVDGFEATAAIRAAEARSGGHVPVIAMTAHAMKGDREKCLEAGMDDYVAKPVRARTLFGTIRKVLDAGNPPHPSPAPAGEEDAAVDWAHALEGVQGDSDLLREVVRAFLEESPGMLASIREAVAKGRADELRRASHTLKSTLRLFGQLPAFRHARKLEELGEAGAVDRAGQVLAALEESLARVTAALKERLSDGSESTEVI